jgi:hypothetical protein
MDHVTLAITVVGPLCPYLGEPCLKPDIRRGDAAVDAGDLEDWDL